MSACYFPDATVNTAPAWRARIIAGAVALAAHLLLAAFLLQHWQMKTPPAPVVRHLHTTLITLPAPPPPAEPPAVSKPQLATPPKPDKAQLARQQQARERKAEQTQRRQQEKQQQQQALAQQRADDEQRRQAALQSQAAARAAQNARQAAEAESNGRQYQPISKQTPDYPEKALSRKIEGNCTVVYRVNRRGEVEDPQAQSDCNPLFVRTSINAAKTFRYQPRVINGQPVDVPQVKNTFHYRIQ
ncbi:energy transducer TonB [Gibbsiella quercinecans]|uniref:energy transducer TonB n=1 Tax=Gibbsiella quercinecans TaxID=929813 RepID=UPI003A4D737F